jgi:NADPH-dependent curcumin reductase CurA
MTDTQVRRWRMRRRPVGAIAAEDFVLEAVALAPLGDGQVLTQTRFISLDPYLARMMRSWEGEAPGWSQGLAHGRVVAQVIESRSPRLAAGDWVLGLGRWQERDIFPAEALERIDVDPPQTALGVLGRSGLTAWVGLHLAQARRGETLLVSAATGPVGSVAGQLARRRGLRVVGTAGGGEKCRHAVEALGFDACIDRRAADFAARLAEALPDGIDILFENVGGPSLDPALPLMNKHGRIMLCGLVAHYNSDAPLSLANFKALLYSQLNLRAFATADHPELFAPALAELRALVASGDLRYDETLIDGIENAPAAYVEMLAGGGVGKRLVRVADPATASASTAVTPSPWGRTNTGLRSS